MQCQHLNGHPLLQMRGKNLLSYISEHHLVITKAKCGDTRTEGSLEELTDIQNPKDMVLYPSQSIESNLQFRITLSNQNILTGFAISNWYLCKTGKSKKMMYYLW
ncbi:MAG: hypothetical protein ACLSCV_12005 [Acutalibacteraceae bacterium]